MTDTTYTTYTKKDDWDKMICPKSSNEYIGYDYLIDSIKNWLNNYKKYSNKYKITKKDYLDKLKNKNKKEKIKNFKCDIKDENTCSCLLLTGNHGIGKTSLIKIILEELNYEPEIINFNYISSIKDPENYASDILTNVNNEIGVMLKHNEAKNKVIIVDNIESIKFPNERKFSMALIEENTKFWTHPIIFISDSKHNKFTNKNIKPYVYNLNMHTPTNNEMLCVLAEIVKKTNISLLEEDAYKIINNVKYDYRKLLSILKKMYNSGKKNDKEIYISNSQVQECLDYHSKDRKMDIYSSINTLFTENISIDDSLAIYETEKTLYPLMVQKNHVNFILKNCTLKNKLDIIENICDSLAKGDITENQIHCKQDYGLQKVQGYYSCVYTGKKINETIKNTNKTNPNNQNNPIKTYKYPNNYNIESIKNINKNNFKKAQTEFKSMNIMDMLYANEIICNLISNNEHTKYEDIICGYNATPEKVIALIKVDKIDKTKSIIPSTISRIIKKLTK
jgi:DNA polymerase III delta prime subunit